MKQYIFGFITIIWISVIFSFSFQGADKSATVSDSVGDLLLEHGSSETLKESESWSQEERDFYYKVVRKLGHFSEFFVLGALMLLTMNEIKFHRKSVIAFFACVVVAIIDETIQLFVPGRAGLMTDVLIDSFGSMMGVFVCLFIMKRIFEKKIKTC